MNLTGDCIARRDPGRNCGWSSTHGFPFQLPFPTFSMPRVHQLDANVVNKIAAGEVVARPASVVKELLENSVDALAGRIEVDIVQGGSELIRVVDDGEGIHPDDLVLAVTSHATSKIRTDDDLFRVSTMGFRGEALASIAAVCRFRVRTRQAAAARGVELEVNCGTAASPKPAAGPRGTLTEVRQLFANTPVRRRFLKTTGTEFGHISEQFSRIAIANPRLHMVLRHNDRLVYELPATDGLLDRLRLFYGSELTDHLIEVESSDESGADGGPGIRVWGYVARPSHSKSTRKGQYLFLNGRWIQDRSLQHALSEAYRGLLMTGRYPVTFLFLEMPPHLVDVNVHPTKSEVRFRDSQQLYRRLLTTLRTRFLSCDLDSEFHLSAGREPAARGDDDERQLGLRSQLDSWAHDALKPWNSAGVPAAIPDSAAQTPHTPHASIHAAESQSRSEPAAVDPAAGAHMESAAAGTLRRGDDGSLPRMGTWPAATESSDPTGATDSRSSGDSENQRAVRVEAVPQPFGSEHRAFQLHDCYIVVATEDGLTVIDQHALHERILYEHLRERVLTGGVESQRLLVPEPVEFDPRTTAVVLEQRDVLTELGFGVEHFGGTTILLTGHPVMRTGVNPVALLRDVAEQLDHPDRKPSRRDVIDSLLHMMACKAAIRAGHRLSPEEMESLLAQRHLIDDAHHCPHGRPTALNLSRNTLDKQFGRLG